MHSLDCLPYLQQRLSSVAEVPRWAWQQLPQNMPLLDYFYVKLGC